jgi:hypothetical protein
VSAECARCSAPTISSAQLMPMATAPTRHDSCHQRSCGLVQWERDHRLDRHHNKYRPLRAVAAEKLTARHDKEGSRPHAQLEDELERLVVRVLVRRE